MQSGKAKEPLPPGWREEVNVRNSGKNVKVYIEEATGHRCYTKPQLRQYLEKLNRNEAGQHNNQTHGDSSVTSHMSQHTESVRHRTRMSAETKDDRSNPSSEIMSAETKDDGSKPSSELVLLDEEKMKAVEEIPSGWIKELRPRKYCGGAVKDTFYIDPESGYAFRSKKDVLRYLKTGNIRRCKIRPKKRDITTIHPPSPTKVKHESMSEDFATDSKAVDENESASHGPATPDMLEQEPPENTFCQDSETKLGKSKRNSLDDPTRTSKRLAVLEPVKLPLSGLNEQAKHAPLGANIELFSPSLTVNTAVSMPQQHDGNVETIVADRTPPSAEAPRDTDHQIICPTMGKDCPTIHATSEVPITHQLDPNASAEIAIVPSAASGEVHINHQLDANASSKIANLTSARAKSPVETDVGINRILCSQEQDMQQQQVKEEPEYNIPGSQEQDVQQQQVKEEPEYNIPGSPGDLWSDPCFNFAFKTLTEEIPPVNPVASQPFSQGDTFSPNLSASTGLPAVNFPPMSQNIVPTNLDLLLNCELRARSSRQPSHSNFLPHVNANAVNFPPMSQNIMPTSLDLFLNRDFKAQSSSNLSHSAFPPPTNANAPGSSGPGSQFPGSSSAPYNSGNSPFWLFK